MAALSLLGLGVNSGLSTRSSRDKRWEVEQKELLLAIVRAMEIVVGFQQPDLATGE